MGSIYNLQRQGATIITTPRDSPIWQARSPQAKTFPPRLIADSCGLYELQPMLVGGIQIALPHRPSERPNVEIRGSRGLPVGICVLKPPKMHLKTLRTVHKIPIE